jgi:hypothetical protein
MGGLGIFALIVLLVMIASIIYAVIWLAMWPGKVAHERGHTQAEAINVAGWLGILTGIVWILAMIWAYTVPEDMNPQNAGGGES